jgi:hypothetical protein
MPLLPGGEKSLSSRFEVQGSLDRGLWTSDVGPGTLWDALGRLMGRLDPQQTPVFIGLGRRDGCFTLWVTPWADEFKIQRSMLARLSPPARESRSPGSYRESTGPVGSYRDLSAPKLTSVLRPHPSKSE